MPDLDDVDRAYFDSLIPEGHLLAGYLTVVLTVSPEGTQAWKTHNDIEMPMSSLLGLLEMAKLDLIGRSGCVESLNTNADGDE